MRVLIAPDKFKGTFSAARACESIRRGLLAAFSDIETDLCPLSDGGEGFVDAMCGASACERVHLHVTGPLPEMRVEATYALCEDFTAIIELASCAGLALLPPDDRNPMYTTTFGVGQLMTDAARRGAKRIHLGIGGSATCDAGIGCLQACGCHMVLRSGEYARLSEPLCGRDLDDVTLIKSHRGSPLDGLEIVVACDVTNPLFGPEGAALVFGGQKGATAEECVELDGMLQRLAERTGTLDIAKSPGSGAAGGIGFGLRAFLGARVESGFDMVAERVGLETRIANADVVVTGEGRLDQTSVHGKLTQRVAALARTHGKPLVTLSGDRDRTMDSSEFGITAAITDRFDSARAMSEASSLLAEIAADALRQVKGAR